jgi:hypothetical protein
MDLTEINNNAEKLSELLKENQEKECEFIKKYNDFINDVVVKLKGFEEKNNNNNEERKTKNGKKKERERTNGIEKIQNNINSIVNYVNTYVGKNSSDKEKSKKKTEQKINKCCDEIYDIGTNTFNLELIDVPIDESHQLKKRRSWFSRSLDIISSGDNDENESEEEKKLKEEIEKLEKELEEKKKKLNELKMERKKKEKEEAETEKKNKDKENKNKNKKNEKDESKEDENKEDDKEDVKAEEQTSLLDRIDDLLVDGNCRQAFEFLNNTSLLGTKLLGVDKSKTPRMFIILPDPTKCPNGNKSDYWIKFENWNKSVFTLNLLCESTGGIEENVENETHLLETTGYSIRDPYKLISLFGPFLLYSIDTFMESCGENFPREVTKALGNTKPTDYFISVAHEIQKVLKEERLLYKDETKNLEALESFIEVSRAELQTFLKRYDYSNMFGGLDKRRTNDNKVIWVFQINNRKFK